MALTGQVLAAFVLGVTAGIQPGPLSALVIREASNKGFAAGAVASFAPMATDLPLILAAVLLLRPLSDYPAALTALSVAGAAYCCWLAWETWTLPALAAAKSAPAAGSFRQAVMVNLLNPNPYVFWFTVGGAYLTRGIAEAVTFAVVFLVAIVSTKAGIAWVAARALRPASARTRYFVNCALALLLLALAAQLLWRGAILVHDATEPAVPTATLVTRADG